jgi:cytochrome c
MRRMILSLALLAGVSLPAAAQDLRGHGGPVGALDAGQGVLVSGGFDTRAILWDLGSATARNVTRFHDGNVTAVRLLPAGGFVTAGQDGRLAIWQTDGRAPQFATPAGASAVASLDVSPDGAEVAAGFWDGRVLRLDLATEQADEFQAHSDRVTGLAYLSGGDLVTIGGDLLLVRWTPQSELASRQSLPNLPNGLAVATSGIAVIFADGALRLYDDAGALIVERFLADRPLVSVTSGAQDIAAASVEGIVWLLDKDDLSPRQMFTAASGPVWALAMTDTQVFTSGADGVIRPWSLDGDTPEPVLADTAPAHDDGSRGAEVWRNCAICHSLDPGDHSMAGPSLYALFGRRIASQPGYDYSSALRQMDIIWTPETFSDLFTYGPEAYTPGSRMPEQRIAAAEDRAALIAYLQRITAAQD